MFKLKSNTVTGYARRPGEPESPDGHGAVTVTRTRRLRESRSRSSGGRGVTDGDGPTVTVTVTVTLPVTQTTYNDHDNISDCRDHAELQIHWHNVTTSSFFKLNYYFLAGPSSS
jgi:hypothetical protein